MAQRPKRGKCVHCLKEDVDRTWDHVFPKAWYPDGTKPNADKWRIPSCSACNHEYGTLENDLLVRLGLALDPKNRASKGIVDKALRALNPNVGKNPADKEARLAKRRKIQGQMLEPKDVPAESVFPGMGGNRFEGAEEHKKGILVPKDGIERVTEKIVRGIFWREDGKFIELPYKIDTYVAHDEGLGEIHAMLDKFGTSYAHEPGIRVRRAVVPDDGMSSFFEIELWKQFKVYASVSLENPAELGAPHEMDAAP